MFVVDSGSARQTQADVNQLMQALAELLEKFQTHAAKPSESKPAAIAVNQEWEYAEPVQENSQILVQTERLPVLEGFDPRLLTGEQPIPQISGATELPLLDGQQRLPQLEGFDPQILEGQPTPAQLTGTTDLPLLDASADLDATPTTAAANRIVQIDLGDLQMAGTIAEVQAQIQNLSPEQLATLNEAVQQPAGTTGVPQPVSISVDGISVLARDEQGLMQVNDIQPVVATLEKEPVSLAESTPAIEDQTDWRTVEAEVNAVDCIAAPEPQPHLEVRPVGEVEVLTGAQIGESSSIHDLVVQQAPSVVVAVDNEGKVKPSAAVRDQVEATEDEVEAEVQTEQQQEQRLTPEAMAVVGQLKDHFAQTGDQFFIGQEYVFEDCADGVRLLPHDASQPPITIVNNEVNPPINSRQFDQLMQRFSSSYERIQVAQGQENYEQTYDLER